MDHEDDSYPEPRPTTLETMATIARAWSRRSTCRRGSVGSVAHDARGFVLSSGYNGAPTGMAHCTEVGCLMDGGHCVRTIHAEMNMLITASRYGVSLEGANVMSTRRPCLRCTVALIQAGIASITYEDEYETDDEQAMYELCHAAGVRVGRIDEPVLFGAVRGAGG